MRTSFASMAMALGWAFLGAAQAQETYRVDVQPSDRIVCDWVEWTEEKATGSSATGPASEPLTEETRNTTIITFRRDGPDLLVAEAYPEYPEDTLYLRFAAGGTLIAAAFDQNSLLDFAQASREEPRPIDREAYYAGLGIYEGIVHGREWSLGDPLHTESYLIAQAEAMAAPTGHALVSESNVVLVEARTNADGSVALVFGGPMSFQSAPNTALPFRSSAAIQIRAVIDQQSGRLIEVTETVSTSVGEGDGSVRSTWVLRGVCRPYPVQ